MTFTWHQPALDFCELWGVPREVVEAAAENPTRVTLNEDSGKDGYVIEDHRRGDVTAVVGLREETPSILYVRVHSGLEEPATRSSQGPGGTTPKTMRGVRARIVADGFSISAGRTHDKVLGPEGEYLYSLPGSPSDTRTPANSWAGWRRVRDTYRLRKRIERGNLLEEETDEGLAP